MMGMSKGGCMSATSSHAAQMLTVTCKRVASYCMLDEEKAALPLPPKPTVESLQFRLAWISVPHDEVKGSPQCPEHGLDVPEDQHSDQAAYDPARTTQFEGRYDYVTVHMHVRAICILGAGVAAQVVTPAGSANMCAWCSFKLPVPFHCILHSLDPEPGVALVEVGCHGEGTIHHDRKQRVHGADVVQHVLVLQGKGKAEDGINSRVRKAAEMATGRHDRQRFDDGKHGPEPGWYRRGSAGATYN